MGLVPSRRSIPVWLFLTFLTGGWILPNASFSQGPPHGSIFTSADSHEARFFGTSFLQTVIEGSGGDGEAIKVVVTVQSAIGSIEDSFIIPETSPGSQTYELFILHSGSDKKPSDPLSQGSLTDDQLIDFGENASDLPIPNLTLFDVADSEVTISVEYRNDEIQVQYEEFPSVLRRDGDVYGSDSLMYLIIEDQDANLDPTGPDEISVSSDDANVLFTIDGAIFEDDLTFVETSDNTAIFEAQVQISTDASSLANELVFSSQSVTMILNDMANYDDVGFDNEENDSTNGSIVKFSIDDSDGVVTFPRPITFSNELALSVVDRDSNRDSQDDESYSDALVVTTPRSSADIETFDLSETDDNTGLFAVDISDDLIPVTFLGDDQAPIHGNGILELSALDTSSGISIDYLDTLDNNSERRIIRTNAPLDMRQSTISLPNSVGVEDSFTLMISGANLNDYSNLEEFYTLILSAEDDRGHLVRDGHYLDDFVNLVIEIEGEEVQFNSDIITDLEETAKSTGVFEAELDMDELLSAIDIEVADGDKMTFYWAESFGDSSESSESMLISGDGRQIAPPIPPPLPPPILPIDADFSRAIAPIPPTPSSDTAELLDSHTVVVTLTITDPAQNEISSAEDTIELAFQDNIEGAEPSFRFQLDSRDNSEDEVISGNSDYSESLLRDIMPELTSVVFTETSTSTGVFDEELEFVNNNAAIDWQGLRITLFYISEQGKEASATLEFSGDTASLSVDKHEVAAGDVVNVSIADSDLNLDDEDVEEFETSYTTQDDYLLAVETQDKNLCSMFNECAQSNRFIETGPDTGVFESSITIGNEVPIVVSQSTQVVSANAIVLTFNDEISSSGAGGEPLIEILEISSSLSTITVSADKPNYLLGDDATASIRLNPAVPGKTVLLELVGRSSSTTTRILGSIPVSASEVYTYHFTIPLDLTDGTYNLQVKLDDVTATSSGFTIVAPFVNLPPVARIDAPSSIVGGMPLILDGSGSTDPNPNTTLNFSWSQISGPNAPVSDWGSSELEFTPLPVDQAVEMTFGLVVSDGELSSNQVTASITVPSTPNERPVAQVTKEITVDSGGKVELDGSGSSDLDGDLLTYSWVARDTLEISLENESDAFAEFSAPITTSDTRFEVLLTVNDGKEDSEPAVATIFVKAAPTPDPGPTPNPNPTPNPPNDPGPVFGPDIVPAIAAPAVVIPGILAIMHFVIPKPLPTVNVPSPNGAPLSIGVRMEVESEGVWKNGE